MRVNLIPLRFNDLFGGVMAETISMHEPSLESPAKNSARA
jgi:hypothetical protein